MLLETASDKSDWIEDHLQISLFFVLSLTICKMKQASLKGDRAFAAWHSRGLGNHPWTESSCHVVDQSRLCQSKKHKAGESCR